MTIARSRAAANADIIASPLLDESWGEATAACMTSAFAAVTAAATSAAAEGMEDSFSWASFAS
jgi:hypothetical protein